MRFFVGTSGYSYKEWKGSFYPEKLPAKEMLSYYAQRFSTVEINNTFYRMPKESVLQSWAEQVPEHFQFVLKAPQKITHFKRLKEAESETDYFLRTAAVLGPRLGPVLFQLPPVMKKDVARLDAFLAAAGGRARMAVEFRHESWFDNEVFECLRANGCAICLADTDELPDPELVSTTDWGYVRLRRVQYDDAAFRKWAETLKKEKWADTYVFFKHEDSGTGPQYASRFVELVSRATNSGAVQ